MADLFRRPVVQEQILKEKDLQLFNFVKQCFATKAQDGNSAVQFQDAVYDDNISPVEAALKKKYERRQELLRCGFFTPLAKPYRGLGTVITNSQDLFTPYMSFEQQRQLRKIMEKRSEDKSIIKIVQAKPEQMKKPQAPSAEQSKRQNGYFHIHEYLEENKWITNAMHTGKPLSLCLKELDEMYAEALRQKEFGTLTMAQEKSRRYSRKPVDEPVPFSTLRNKAARRYKECGLLTQQIPKDLDQEEQLESIHARRREYINEKLQTIYSLLCGVVNMKCKDLKRFMPLPLPYVEFLLEGPEEGENPFPLGLSQLLRINRQKMTKCYPSMHLDAKELRTPELAWKTFLCNDNGPLNSGECRRTSQVLSTTAASLISELTESEAAVFELPPWLALIEAKNTTELRFRQKLRESKDTIQTLKATFTNLQKTMAKLTQRRLLLKKENRTIRMGAILQLLDISPEVDFGTMIDSIDHDTKVLEPPKHPPLWFTILMNESLEFGTPEETNPLLQKLAFFHHFTASSVPSAEEKLCLLAVSLPAHQLLKLAVQDALLFIVQCIFKCSSRHVKQWFQYRKLPFTLECGL
ncbi:uncharacterized protein LOC119965893 isoform X1 [Scyliorhinus canicula]|uniref:uncharacterized protein LOC119965893 isoform X1 n=1 Tax=Scyliorhinus canicula TaxID=7830 RepID=UPI0018F73369|nr:uncharacterized protein LOC119965893 isoform X1 [Scyliorhinus canicula]XP_038652790.1 uncharacterized protein LOC119965893 isoform X1 [Scyliorhinus canicula]